MDVEHEQDQAPSDQVTERRGWKSYWKQQLFKEIILSNMWVCLKIVYPYTQWLMIIIPTKWL